MSTEVLVVVYYPKRWPLKIPGVTVVSAREYLANPEYSARRRVRVFNLCRSYQYQSLGYYVSLLADGRGHRPLPSVATIQDMRSSALVQISSDDLDELIQTSLRRLQANTFTLSVYFGRNVAECYDRLSRRLFNMFPLPFLRAQFEKQAGRWKMTSIRPIAAAAIPESHQPLVNEYAMKFFARRPRIGRPGRSPYTMAILHDPAEREPPSNRAALKKFLRAARGVGIDAELVTRDDYGRIAEYDALFIRETTAVNHHTFRFAGRAEAEGLVVIDDPQSIIRCTNKVFLAELLARRRIPTPRTVIVHEDNVDSLASMLGLPCILKLPDGSFSRGVVKVDTPDDLRREAARMLESSDLIIAQEFVPTPFDWRIGVLAGKPLFACQYYMAERHWQIIRRDPAGRVRTGADKGWPVHRAPPVVVSTAVRAARLIGNGFYGVDLKEISGKPVVLEVNDNPNVDAGIEDSVLKDALYQKIMRVFLSRLTHRHRNGRPAPSGS